MGKFLDRINYVFALICGAMFVFIMLLMACDVVARYFFNSPLIFQQDITTHLMLLAIFWAAGYVMSSRGFPNVDIIYRKFSPVKQALVDLIGYLGGLAYLIVLMWQIFNLAIDAYLLKTNTTSPVMIPLFFPYLGMFIGLVLFILEICRQVFRLATYTRRSLRGTKL